MINLNLNITVPGINAEAEEKVRVELRKRMLGFILSEMDKAFRTHSIAFNHADVKVDGEITIKDNA